MEKYEYKKVKLLIENRSLTKIAMAKETESNPIIVFETKSFISL